MKLGTLTAFLVMAGTGTSASATSLYYDGFIASPYASLESYGYTITAEPDLSPPNSGTKLAEINPGGLSIPGQVSAGNAAHLYYEMVSGAVVDYTATKDITDFGSAGGINTFYVSGLFKTDEFPETTGAWIKLGVPVDFTSGADRYFSIGLKHTQYQGVLQDQIFAEGLGTQYGNWKLADYTEGDTVQVIAKFTYFKMTGSDQYGFEVFAAANPSSTVEPTWKLIASESNLISGFTIPNLELTLTRSGSFAAAGGVIDEIRIGTNYADVVGVVPEPEAWFLMLAGLGLLGWKARQRG